MFLCSKNAVLCHLECIIVRLALQKESWDGYLLNSLKSYFYILWVVLCKTFGSQCEHGGLRNMCTWNSDFSWKFGLLKVDSFAVYLPKFTELENFNVYFKCIVGHFEKSPIKNIAQGCLLGTRLKYALNNPFKHRPLINNKPDACRRDLVCPHGTTLLTQLSTRLCQNQACLFFMKK